MKKNILAFLNFILILFSNICFASNTIIQNPGNANLPSQAQGLANSIIGWLQWGGYVIAIGMIVFAGIKYIIAAADEKASLKGMLTKIVIGSIIIATASTIVRFLATQVFTTN